jgi:amino acid transporter
MQTIVNRRFGLVQERIYGPQIASVFTVMILWTAFGSVFALLLGYSRIPYAAAREGYFFKAFARLHPRDGFPHVSLIVLGVVLLRRRAPSMARPFVIWLYPAPVVLAGVGWLFIFSTTGVSIILFALGLLALGVLGFLMWSRRLRQRPFAAASL